MGAMATQQMADRVAGLLEERLKIRGQGLSAKLSGARRHVPRKVAIAAAKLAEAAEMSQNPKLMLQIDDAKVADAYDTCVRYLAPLGAGARRRGVLTSVAAQLVVGLLALALIGWVIARMRGLA